MKKIERKEPKSLLEIRAIKSKLFKEFETLGWDGFHKKCREVGGDLIASIEKRRKEKLAGRH
jgi:hypothetical protein